MQKTEVELLTFAQMSKRVGLGRSAVYQRIKEEMFPRPVSLGTHCVRWRSDEISKWIEAQTTRPESNRASVVRAKNAVAARKRRSTAAPVCFASKA
jgi:prophage regulatory protein